jgi:hypothetical protein
MSQKNNALAEFGEALPWSVDGTPRLPPRHSDTLLLSSD